MIQIRPCCAEDFDEVILLLRQLWLDKALDPTSLRPIFDRALVSPSKTYLCATDEKRVIGFGSFTVKENLWPEGHLGYVDELVVDTEYRSKGIGKQLLEQLIAVARQKDCCRIELDSAFYRKESHRFYKRNGFEKRAYVFSKILHKSSRVATIRTNKIIQILSEIPSLLYIALLWNVIIAEFFIVWAEFDASNLEQFCGSKTLFPIITLILTVAGIVFGVSAIADSVKQAKETKYQRDKLEETTSNLKQISQALPTVYIGKFPKHLAAIKSIVENSYEQLCIMVDCVDYGSFSDPKLHDELLKSIINAKTNKPKLKVQILLCGKMQAITRNSPYFGKTFVELKKIPAFIDCLKYYVGLHNIKEPDNGDRFFKMLDDYQKIVGKQLTDVGVEIKKIDKDKDQSVIKDYPGIFFWLEDKANAVFLLSYVGFEAQEIAFRTRDANLTGIFTNTFEKHWENAEKIERSHWK